MAAGFEPVWEWPREEIEAHYTQGACHVLAVALRSLTGLPMGVMWNPFDWHVEPDANGKGGVLEVVHVFVREPGGMVVDVRGRRTLDEMRRDLAGPDWEACPCEELADGRLRDLVHDSGNLVPFGEGDVEEAVEVIRRDPALSAIVREHRPGWEGAGPAYPCPAAGPRP